jgi:YggT family protein
MRALLDVILIALEYYSYAIVISAVLSWLVAFNVINIRNQVVRAIVMGLYQITEPAFRPVRRLLPSMGTMDISPIIVLLLIMLIERVILIYIYPHVF